MPDASGFDLFDDEMKDFETIFITAHSQYALHAFNVNASAYLLKPIVSEQLIKAMNEFVFIKH